jgi:pilus assembly protein Flp/PilA
LSHFIRGKLEARVVIIRKFLKDENGATAIEDGLIAAGISVPIIANVTSLGGKLVTTFGKVDTALN